jgi:hypothetical protein
MCRENITRIKVVYDALEERANEVVFVGGATVALYADRPSGEARPTDDVDILMELMHYQIKDLQHQRSVPILDAEGRKNLFAGSHEAAQRSAMLYSLLGTCKMHKIEPY